MKTLLVFVLPLLMGMWHVHTLSLSARDDEWRAAALPIFNARNVPEVANSATPETLAAALRTGVEFVPQWNGWRYNYSWGVKKTREKNYAETRIEIRDYFWKNQRYPGELFPDH